LYFVSNRKETIMRGLKISILILISGMAVCGCKEQKQKAAQEKGKTEKEVFMSVTLQWLGHASFKITKDDVTIYIDPWKLADSAHDATVVLVSHGHYDHYSASDVTKVSGPQTKFIASADVVGQHGKGQPLQPGQSVSVDDITITGVAAYNPAKQFHPKANNWLGFVIEIGDSRIYYAGDTDMTEEMKVLKGIDIALLPVGGTYTMNAAEAAEAVEHFKPVKAVPYHWGDIVGGRKDADNFAKKAKCEVTVLTPGETLSL